MRAIDLVGAALASLHYHLVEALDFFIPSLAFWVGQLTRLQQRFVSL